jgi:hypothetical protein
MEQKLPDQKKPGNETSPPCAAVPAGGREGEVRSGATWDDERIERELTSCLYLKMEPTTEMRSVLEVKCFIPRSPLSCCIMMIIAVPPMNPVIVDRDRKSTISPNLHHPNSPQSVS